MKILITGATDGIGLETAKKLKALGHILLVHGRSQEKLERVGKELGSETYQADLSSLNEVKELSRNIASKHSHIDIVINNAGVYKTPNPMTKEGFDIRFMVNTFAPYLLTKNLLPLMNSSGRVINLSSAAQAVVESDALLGKKELNDFEAYAQSKLAITMWSRYLAQELKGDGPAIISVNPGSLLGTKMVKEGFGTSGNDISIGVNILTALALDEQYQADSGKYFDNDAGKFSPPQADGANDQRCKEIVKIIDSIVNR